VTCDVVCECPVTMTNSDGNYDQIRRKFEKILGKFGKVMNILSLFVFGHTKVTATVTKRQKVTNLPKLPRICKFYMNPAFHHCECCV